MGRRPAAYTYDADGRRVRMTDGTGTTTSTYDSLGRLTGSTDGAGNTLGYGYDLAGRLTSLTYPSGVKVMRGYDAAGRLTSVTDWLGHTTRFGYDQAGELTRVLYPNHVVDALTYDIAGRLLSEQDTYQICAPPCSIAWKLLASFSYTRDPAGMLASAKSTGATQSQEVYGYTTLNQLASVAPAGGSATTYVYDKADEPTQLGAASLVEDGAGEVTMLTQGTASTAFTYDTRGNRVKLAVSGGASASYGFDEANRLTLVSGIAVGTTSYAYNGDGLRMRKTVGSASAERFVWDTAGGMPLLLVDGATSFITGPGGLPLGQITGSGSGATALYYLQDQLGSTRALVDGAGAIAASYTYDAYGATTAHTGSASTPLQYAGQYFDAETGLYQLRARSYDPATAQFLSRDPLVPLTKQPYVYAGDNPLNATDPSGLASSQSDSAYGQDPSERFINDIFGGIKGTYQDLLECVAFGSIEATTRAMPAFLCGKAVWSAADLLMMLFQVPQLDAAELSRPASGPSPAACLR
jgi:RHS repeat-associated protein